MGSEVAVVVSFVCRSNAARRDDLTGDLGAEESAMDFWVGLAFLGLAGRVLGTGWPFGELGRVEVNGVAAPDVGAADEEDEGTKAETDGSRAASDAVA